MTPSLSHATATALRLRTVLEREVEEVRLERTLLKSLDAEGLLRRAAARTAFNTALEELGVALEESLRTMGLATPVDAALATMGHEGERLAGTLGEVRALASALRELDQFNRALANRTLLFVRGYMSALSPGILAYDRRGSVLTSIPPERVSEHA